MWPFKIKKKKKRKYEAASKSSRVSCWLTPGGDANSSIKGDLSTLRNRSRALKRNNPYYKKGINLLAQNIVGIGVSTQFSNDEVQNLWKEWAGKPNCDYDGRQTFKGIQRLAVKSIIESGEVFLRRRIVPGLTIPLQYQVLESDFLPNSEFTITPKVDGHKIKQGIEFDKDGKRYGYHFYQEHPGSTDYGYSTTTIFVPENEVIHLFKQERPGQVRGVTWGTTVMVKLKDLDDYDDAELMKQKVAACFTAFVHDISEGVECEEEDDAKLGERIEPALIEHLPPGKTVTFSNPPKVEGYKDVSKINLHAAASGLGVTYEGLASDYSDTNYSSARMGKLDTIPDHDSDRDDIIVAHLINRVVDDFIFILNIIGFDTNNLTAVSIAPKRDLIDPTKEIPAMIDKVRAGFESRSSIISSLGNDPKDVYDRIQKDNDQADELGFVFDSDPRKVQKNGKLNMETSNEQENQDT